MGDASITFSIEDRDVAVLVFNDPRKGANVLSQPLLQELDSHLTSLEKRGDLAGLVIRSGKPGSFIAGADLREFAASVGISHAEAEAICHRGRKLFERLSRLPFVTVAAIDGVCLGGGAELAVWCDRRVMADDTKSQIGFPEVKLGLFPGWGGTARLPRIVGLGNAVEMITGGEAIGGKAANAMGLASDVVSVAHILPAAINLVRAERRTGEYLLDRRRWAGPVSIDETELMFLGATASAYIQHETKGHYPAPVAALEVMLEAAGLDIDAACNLEAAGMAKLFGSAENRALLNVFFLGDRNKKDSGIDHPVEPRKIKSVGVIGAGIMGAGIAAANLRRELPVVITDAAAESLARGVQSVLEEVSYNKEIKGPDVQRAVRFAPLVKATASDAEFAACDLVIEAVVENADVKRAVFSRLEPLLRPDAILATNTSTIPITELAKNLKRPEQFCGIHFFNPVRKMPLVEIIRGALTSDQTVGTAVAYAKGIGKSPIVVRDGPGFLVNRLLFPYMQESLELLAEGVEIKAIERAATEFGMPMGPMALYDMVGLDTALFAGSVLAKAFPDRIILSPILPALVKAGRLGQKSGAGFFNHRGRKGRPEPDPALADVLKPFLAAPRKASRDELTARLFLPMLLEATRVLDEKLVRDPRDVDLGLIYGIGFPPFRGGLLFWADTLGAAKIVDMLKPYEKLGERMRPTTLLLEMAKSRKRFYQTI